MAFSWGTTTLNVLVGSWKPGVHAEQLTEIPLIPDAENISAVCSILQQGGRLRKRIKAKLYVTSMTEYEAFISAKLAGTAAILTDADTLNASYMIEALGEPDYKQDNVIFFDITFVEV